LVSGDGALARRRVAAQGRLDLTELDAISANLHLLIHAAEELDVARWQPAGPIARAIEARPGLVAQRVRDESFVRQVGPVQVTAGQAVAADVELAGRVPRNGPQVRVEQEDFRVGDGPSDGRQGGPIGRAAVQGVGRHHVAFRRPILVFENRVGKPGEETRDARCDMQLLTGGDDLAQAGRNWRVRAVGLGELL
jgi:hypothetical protein